MGTLRRAGKAGSKPVEHEIEKAETLKIDPEVEIEEQLIVTRKSKRRSEKTSTQDNQLLGGN